MSHVPRIVVADDATRSLAGRAGHVLRVVSEAELPEAVRDLPAAWIIRAGTFAAAWAHPPASATGKPLCALGFALDIETGELDAEAVTWLQKTSGSHTGIRAAALPTIARVYVEQPAQLFLRAQSLEASIDQAASTHRVVYAHNLDAPRTTRLRVALAITCLHRGGAERVVLALYKELRGQGVDVLLMVADAPQRECYEVPGGKVFLAYGGAAPREQRLRNMMAAAMRFGADVVHAHLFGATELELLRVPGVPLVSTAHNAAQGWPDGLAQARCDLVLGCALGVSESLRRAGVPSVRTAWNAVGARSDAPDGAPLLRQALGLPPAVPLLLSVANPRPQKRLELLIDVLATLRAQGCPAELVLIGAPLGTNAAAHESARVLQERVVQHGLEAFVHHLGSRSDVAQFYAVCDVYVCSSAYEGLSVSFLEALAAGCPVVCPDVHGARELSALHEGVRVVSHDDLVPGMAAAVRALMDEPVRPSMHAAFSPRVVAARHAELYTRVLDAAREAVDAVLLVTNNFSIGGAQSSARRLLLELGRMGHAVSAAVLEEQKEFPTPGRAALEAAGVPVFVAPRAGSCDPAHAVRAVVAFARRRGVLRVVFWNVIPEYKLLLADALLGVQVFDVSPGEMFFASFERYFRKPRPGLPYLSLLDYGQLLTGVIVKYTAECERAHALGAPVHVVPNGVCLAPAPAVLAPDTAPRVGALARIGPDKKLEQLLDAFRLVHASVPHARFIVAGGAERGAEAYAETLRAHAAGLPVQWLGSLDTDEASRAFLSSLHVFAQVSEPAGCPNASLEAMALGVPVVATEVGGMAEQVVHGLTGALVPRGAGPALGRALVGALEDFSTLRRWGQAAHARAQERFSVDRMARDYARVLGLLADGSSGT